MEDFLGIPPVRRVGVNLQDRAIDWRIGAERRTFRSEKQRSVKQGLIIVSKGQIPEIDQGLIDLDA
jgi:hypothetical protein